MNQEKNHNSKWSNYKFRASSIGDLMAMGRGKKDDPFNIGATAISKLHKIINKVEFGRIASINSHYLDKGLIVEEKAIQMLSEIDGINYNKNEIKFSNEFVEGTPDIIGEFIDDNKSSWDIDTFPRFEKSLPSKDKKYEWQVRMYMWLTGIKKARIRYTLMDTPHHLVYGQIRRLDFKFNWLELGRIKEGFEIMAAREIKQMIFSYDALIEFMSIYNLMDLEWFDDFIEIPIEKRVKTFEFEHDEGMIGFAKDRIIALRNILEEKSPTI